MPKVKLTGAVRRVAGEFHPMGAIVDVDAATAERLIANGVAEKASRGVKAEEVKPADVLVVPAAPEPEA